MKFTLSRTLSLIGGFITLAFGVWHSVTPWLYHWFDYIPSAPDELINAIGATNFFLSVALVLLGTLTIAVTVWQWHCVSAVKLVLWIMTVLWVIRTAYQIVMPQGTAIRGLSMSLVVIFSFTALCFFLPSLMLMRKQDNKIEGGNLI